MNYKSVILDLGHLRIYHKITFQHPFGDGMLYYQDKRFPVEVGPFFSKDEAINHWTAVIEDIADKYQKEDLHFIEDGNQQQPEVLDNVIHVDFKTKQRIKR